MNNVLILRNSRPARGPGMSGSVHSYSLTKAGIKEVGIYFITYSFLWKDRDCFEDMYCLFREKLYLLNYIPDL